MSYQSILSTAKNNMNEAIDYLKDEFKKFKSGRAQTGLVEDIMVEYYGTKTPLKQIAMISAPDVNLIAIQPFDRNSNKDIEKAIANSKLNLTTNSDGQIIRIVIPQLTQERREEMLQVLNQKIEEIKVSIRTYRDEANKEIKNLESSKQISEDDKFKAKKELDDLVQKYNSLIDEMQSMKEKEIMTV